MNKIFTILLFLLFAQFTFAQNNGIVPGVVRIKLKPEVVTDNYGIKTTQSTKGKLTTGIKSLDRVNAMYAVTSMKRVFPYSPKFEERHIKHGLHLWYEITFSAKVSSIETADAYSKLAEVEKSEIVHEAVLDNGGGIPRYAPVMAFEQPRPSAMPFNDPYLSKQWDFNNYGQTGGTPGQDINLFNAWNLTKGAPSVIVSIHDQGVDYQHEDLRQSMWVNQLEMNGTTGVDDDGNGYLDDIHGVNFADNTGTINVDYHGTHVAGTIAAQNNNGIGVCGIAGGSGNNDGARIMTCQIMGGSRGADIPASYVYAADMGAVISQNSWGYTTPGYSDEAVLVGIKYFVEEAGNYPGSPMRGGVVFFASGNENTEELSYPAASPLVIAVDALNSRSTKAQYSNYGTWTDISAPGGDSGDDVELGSGKDYSNSIMSTLDHNAYGYLDGTSMACPHVSGIAALIVSKWGGPEFTSEELKRRILTGVRNLYDIDANKTYYGKLGVGAADAVLALAEDKKIAPSKINDLALVGIAQDFATLTWSVPADEDDGIPVSFEIIYSKDPITNTTLPYAKIMTLPNKKALGETQTYEIKNLLALTEYYFSVRSIDRWGHVSDFSNMIKTKTNSGPAASFDNTKPALTLSIDVRSNVIGKDSINLVNTGDGLLRWDALSRNTLIAPLGTKPALNYPVIQNTGIPPVGIESNPISPSILNNIQRDTMIEKGYVNDSYGLWIIGESNTKLPNSSATRFYTGKDRGFNLTHADAFLKWDSLTGPVIFEVYQGPYIADAKLVYAQEIKKQTGTSSNTGIKLSEQIYFEKDTWFWLVYHVPAGNRYPLGSGIELYPIASQHCYMSLNVGKSWKRLEDMYYDNRAVWAVYALELQQKMNDYLVLSPDSGIVASNDQVTINARVNGSQMINGTYNSNLVVNTNETGKPMLRIPVNVTVKGHLPVIESQKRTDFGGVMLGKTRDINITFRNTGLGRFNFAPQFISITDPQFMYVKGIRNVLEAGTSMTLTFRFIPAKVGNNFCSVTLLDKDGNKYTFELFGAGLAPPVAKLNPLSATFNNLALGDSIVNTVSLSNSGKYPLDYYLPAFANGSNMETIPTDIAKFGYTYQIDTTGASYAWNDISQTGKDITSLFNGNYRTNIYTKVPLNFDFPFYGKVTDSVNISKYGLVAFDDNVNHIYSRVPMAYKYSGNPQRYVSGAGFPMKFQEAGFGKIYYRLEADKLIVQYEDVPYYDGDGYDFFEDNSYFQYRAAITFQIVLHDNGNIDLVYKKSELHGSADWTCVSMEDQTKMDGILFKDHEHLTQTLFNFQPKSVIHIYNPGMGLFTHVSNPFGTILPGDSVSIKYTVKTDSLYLLSYHENLVVVTNDPFNNPAIHSVNFNINKGGEPQVATNINSFDFGTIFKGDVKTNTFLVSNSGKAVDSVKTAKFDYGYYTLTGNVPEIIKPHRDVPYILTIRSNTVGLHNDTLRITTSAGKVIKIALKGEVIQGPILNLQSASGSNLTSITRFLNAGNTTTVNFKINNSGAVDLHVSPLRNQWASTREKDSTANEFSYSYFYKSSKDFGGPGYEWIEIVGQGSTQIKGLQSWTDKQWSEPIKLPFKFNFYGNRYDTLYVGYNGILTFTKGQLDYNYLMGGQTIPTVGQPDNFIAPLFGFLTEDWIKKYPETGIYYKTEADRIIVEYRDYNRASVMGDPISFEAILNADGTIKFQYKLPANSTNYVTAVGVIGIENSDGTDGVLISENQYVVNTDMSFMLYPARTYAIKPSASKDFIMDLSARELVAGTYTDSIAFKSNDPLAKNKLLPVRLVVSGTAQIESPSDISFGDVLISSSVSSITKEFEIKNTGTADFVISKSIQNHPETIKLYAFIPNKAGDLYWQQIYNNTDYVFPQTVFARKSLKMKAVIAPATPQVLNDDFIITTNLPVADYKIHFDGQVYLPAVAKVSQDTISYYAQTEKFQTSHDLVLSNTGGYMLNYKAGIDYLRDSVLPAPTAKTTGTYLSPKGIIPTLEPVSQTITAAGPKQVTDGFNRILSHDTATIASNLLGYGGSRVLYAATGFYAPAEGFNLTHVQTWYAPEDWLNSKIKVMVYSGDEDINVCKLLYTETFNYDLAQPDKEGKLLTLKLAKNIEFYPNEKFYIAFGYEAATTHPQGCVQIKNNIPNRYLFGAGTDWDDLSNYTQFKDLGWLMRAIEEAPSSTPWVVLASNDTGNIQASQADTLHLRFDARSVKAKHNYAKLLLRSNDVKTPVKEVILHLAMNQAPVFEPVSESLHVSENDTLKFSVTALDLEGDNFEVSIDSSYKFLENITGKNSPVKSTAGGFSAKTLYFQYTPGFSSQGANKFSFTASDQFGYTRKYTVVVNVDNVNRPPVALAMDTIRLRPAESFKVLHTADLFTDPDDDISTISAVSDNTGVINVFASESYYLLPMANGITKITFVATDAFGAVSTNVVPVLVDEHIIMGMEEKGSMDVFHVYPNPTSDFVVVNIPVEIRDNFTVSVMNTAGLTVKSEKYTHGNTSVQVDFSKLPAGIYMLKLSDNNTVKTSKIIKQ